MKKLFLLFISLFLLISCTSVKNTEGVIESENKTISITSTIPPFSSIAQYIGGENVNIHTLIQPGYSVHNFNIKPSDIKNIQTSDLVLATGLEIDNFILKDISDANIIFLKNGISLLQGHEHNHSDEHIEVIHEGNQTDAEIYFDPHFWLSLENSKIIAANIKNQLIFIDAKNIDFYTKNYNDFVTQADNIKNDFMRANSQKKQKDFIVFHEAYNYLFDELGINHDKMLVLEETAGREPSVGEIKKIIDDIKAKQIKVIFKEPQFQSKLITTLTQNNNLEVNILDPLGAGVDKNGYFDNIKSNLNNLKNIYE